MRLTKSIFKVLFPFLAIAAVVVFADQSNIGSSIESESYKKSFILYEKTLAAKTI